MREGATRAALAAMGGVRRRRGALHAIVRGLQLVLFPEPNPATVIWSAHAGYFWRVSIVAYAGGMAALMTWIAAGSAPESVARGLVKALVVAAGLIALHRGCCCRE